MKRPVTFLRKRPSNAEAKPDSIPASFLGRVPLPAARYPLGRCISRQFEPTPVGEFDIPRADSALKAFNYITGPDRKPARKHSSFTDHSTLPYVQIQGGQHAEWKRQFRGEKRGGVYFVVYSCGRGPAFGSAIPRAVRCHRRASRAGTRFWMR
jgi:hypothetical protein